MKTCDFAWKNEDFAWKSSEEALKKLEKPDVFADFAPKSIKFIGFFDEKRFQGDPKLCATMRNQVGVHGDPLRNHRAEAEEARH